MFKRWTGHDVNLLSCGVYLGLPLAVLVFARGNQHDSPWLMSVLIGVAIIGFAYNAWRYHAISSAPVSSIAAAAQGYIELNGLARPIKPMQTPLHRLPCVWYRAWVYAQDGEHLWRLLSYQQSEEAFMLDDGSGVCTVQPQGAEVIHLLKKSSQHHGHRYVEEYLPANKPLYLIGYLDTRHHFNSTQATNANIAQLISSWKANPAQLMFRFDLDRNGKIDTEEWEKARTDARAEVARQQPNQSHLGDFQITAPADGQLYLLSGLSPQWLRASYRCWIFVHVSVLIGLSLAVAVMPGIKL